MASNLSSKKYLDYDGLTYLVQNHVIDRKVGTAVGDMLYVSAINNSIPTYGRIGLPTTGNDGHYILWSQRISGTNATPSWLSFDSLISGAGIMTNPMTAEGDIIYASNQVADGKKVPNRLGLGTTGQVLMTINDTNSKQPSWKTIAWLVGTYNSSTNPYTDAVWNSNSSGKICLNLPDITSIPTTGTGSIEALFS